MLIADFFDIAITFSAFFCSLIRTVVFAVGQGKNYGLLVTMYMVPN